MVPPIRQTSFLFNVSLDTGRISTGVTTNDEWWLDEIKRRKERQKEIKKRYLKSFLLVIVGHEPNVLFPHYVHVNFRLCVIFNTVKMSAITFWKIRMNEVNINYMMRKKKIRVISILWSIDIRSIRYEENCDRLFASIFKMQHCKRHSFWHCNKQKLTVTERK